MAEAIERVLGWGAIIAILIVVCLAAGLVFGAAEMLFGLPPIVGRMIVGATVGVLAATLIGRRRAALARRGEEPK